MSRETQLAVAAGQQALCHSRLLDGAPDRSRVGVILGAGNVAIRPEDFVDGVRSCMQPDGSFDTRLWEDQGLPTVEPLWLLRCLPNMPACYLAMFHELTGPNNTLTDGVVSAHLAISEAAAVIEEGLADAVITGAVGSRLTSWQPVPPPPGSGACAVRPSEGAAVFVLEERGLAEERGAKILADVLGGRDVFFPGRCAPATVWDRLVRPWVQNLVDHEGTPGTVRRATQTGRTLAGQIGDAGGATAAIELALGLRGDAAADVALDWQHCSLDDDGSPAVSGAVGIYASPVGWVQVCVARDGHASCLAILPRGAAVASDPGDPPQREVA
jgi:hypothetical protein